MAHPIGSIVEVIIEWNILNQRCMSVLHYKVTADSSIVDPVGEAIDVANTVSSPGGIMDAILDCMSANTGSTKVSAQFIRGAGGQRFAKATVTAINPGVRAASCTVSNIAAVITKRTIYSGRWAVGSLHIPGLSPGTYDNGKITDASMLGDLNDVAAELLNPITGNVGAGVYSPVVLHKAGVHGGSTDLLSTEVQTTVRTMRRRTVGLGI